MTIALPAPVRNPRIASRRALLDAHEAALVGAAGHGLTLGGVDRAARLVCDVRRVAAEEHDDEQRRKSGSGR